MLLEQRTYLIEGGEEDIKANEAELKTNALVVCVPPTHPLGIVDGVAKQDSRTT